MDNYKKNKQKKRKKVMITIIIGLAIIGIIFLIVNSNINFEEGKNQNSTENVVEDFFETNKQEFVLDNCYVDFQGGKYIIGSNSNDTSYFYGSYVIFENEDHYIIRCYFDTHNTSTEIEFFDEYELTCGFEFKLSSDKKVLSPITDFDNFSFDEMMF